MTLDGTLSFARRWAFLALPSLLLLWGGWFWQITEEFIDNDCKVRRCYVCADHLAFYTGARLTWEGKSEHLFDYFGYVTREQASYFEPGVWEWTESFRNPPFYAILYWPTCQLEYAYSAAIWFGISFLLVALGTRWLTERKYWWSLAWIFSFYPTFAAFNYGQNPPISFAILAGTYLLMKKNKMFAAGLVAGLLFFKPNLLLGLAVWGLLDFRRKWPCALGVLTTGCLLAATSWIVLPTATKGFLKTFEANREFDNFEQAKMHNPLSFARLLLPADTIATYFHGELDRKGPPRGNEEGYSDVYEAVRKVHLVFALTMGLAATLVFVRLWRHRRDDLAVMFGGAVFLTLFANPHALIYEWLLLAITGLLWLNEWPKRPNAWFVLYALAWGVLYFSTELNLWILNHEPEMAVGLFGQRWFTVVIPRGAITVQWSIPVLALVGWYAVKLLSTPFPSREGLGEGLNGKTPPEKEMERGEYPPPP